MDVADKLQIKADQSVALVNAPPGLALPGLTSTADPSAADVVIGFVVRRDDLARVEEALAAARPIGPPGSVIPKGGQLGTDLNRDRLAAAATAHGVRPVRQVSIDDTWSALRFRPAAG